MVAGEVFGKEIILVTFIGCYKFLSFIFFCDASINVDQNIISL